MGDAPRRDEDAERERALVFRAKKGDPAALGELLALYRAPIFQLCLHRLGDPSAAEDVLQETFLRALRSFRSFDAARRFFPWLAAIASNRLSTRQRRKPPVSPADPAWLCDSHLNPARADVASEVAERDRLRRALEQLTPAVRRRLLMHDLEGWSCAEVASSEGTTELTVRSSIFRARAALRNMLEELGLVIPALRRVHRRVTLRVQQICSNGLDTSQPLVVASFLTGVLAVSTFGTGTTLFDRTRTARADRITLAIGPGTGVAPQDASARGSRKSGDPTSHRSPDPGAVRWSVTTEDPRPGGATPPEETVSLEIVGPDGQTLFYSHTALHCEEGGQAVVVPAGPVQTSC